MELTIEQKQLLAEEVMEWRKINHKWETVDLGFSIGFFSIDGKRFIHYPPHGSQWTDWRPETDEGDAARLFVKLPLAIARNLDPAGVAIRIPPPTLVWVEEGDFCTAVCVAALGYAAAKRAAREREAKP